VAASSRKWIPWLAGVAVLAVLAIAAFFVFPRHTRALTDKDTVVLSEFVNTTGDAVFDGTLKQALAVQLEQSPYLNLLPESKIQDALKYMGRKPDERISKDLAREIALRENTKAIISGSIASLGNNYVITLEASNAQTGDSLARQQVEAAGKEQVLKSLDKAASELRQRLGESIASVQQFATPLEQATTSSLEALKEYSAGVALHNRLEEQSALPHFKRAVELDPTFAVAYASLGVVFSNTGDRNDAVEYTKKAYDLRERASEREKFYILGHYYGFVTGDEEKAKDLYEQWLRVYPRDNRPLANLALTYTLIGDPQNALAAATNHMRILPEDNFAYQNQLAAFMDLNRFDEAKAVGESAISQKHDSMTVHIDLYAIAAYQKDDPSMQRVMSYFTGKPTEQFFLSRVATRQDSLGQLKLARETAQKTAELAKQRALTGLPLNIMGSLILRDAVHGNVQASRQGVSSLLRQTDDRLNRSTAAVALAFDGDSAQAQKIADDMSRELPDDFYVKHVSAPAVRALALIHENKPADAVAVLEPSRSYDLAMPINNFTHLLMYVRGLAFVQLRDGSKAGAEFQKILDNPGINTLSVFLPLARLQLARAFVLQGDTAKARTAYQDFLALWKDADPDVPVLLQAKSEYNKLP
jgi:tetratricopeptide (TPR) repeat protein